jgi:hypothetical protein
LVAAVVVEVVQPLLITLEVAVVVLAGIARQWSENNRVVAYRPSRG